MALAVAGWMLGWMESSCAAMPLAFKAASGLFYREIDGTLVAPRHVGRPRTKGVRWLLPAALLHASRGGHVHSFGLRSQPHLLFERSRAPHARGSARGGGRSRQGAAEAEAPAPPEGADEETPRLVFPGGGIYFYHQAGVVNFLRKRYDLSSCAFAGASAGALTATLAAADVDFHEATTLALDLAKRAGVWDRTGGLQGIWGALIEEWLDALLPASVAPLQGRITLLVTPVPSFGKARVSRFADREDLIRCNMASIHLSWFLDGKLTADFRGRPHVDGSFLAREDDYRPEDADADAALGNNIVLDWSRDPAMRARGGRDLVEALSPDGIYGLLEQGERYGRALDDRGAFGRLKRLS